MKRDKQGWVVWTNDHDHFRLGESGLDVKFQGSNVWSAVVGLKTLWGTEEGRAKLAEAITALDHPYEGINVHIPPEHRATPRGNK